MTRTFRIFSGTKLCYSLLAEHIVLVLVPLLVVFELADFHLKDGLQLLQRVSLRLEALQVLEVLVVLLKQGLVLLLSKKSP